MADASFNVEDLSITQNKTTGLSPVFTHFLAGWVGII